MKVFTGDNELVTARVCAQVGLEADTILTGPQIERMDDGALSRALHHHRVFARLTPLHKERLVRDWLENLVHSYPTAGLSVRGRGLIQGLVSNATPALSNRI
ncbi:hypothetical protein, partial [Escherichia coli]|uniref:hypothetical protein n=1 Tax=Escherichia coli TaxID=562 RepID=UPI001BC8B33B